MYLVHQNCYQLEAEVLSLNGLRHLMAMILF